MKRYNLNLDSRHDSQINAEAERTGRPKAEIVRNLLDAGMQTRAYMPPTGGFSTTSSQPSGIGLTPGEVKKYSLRNALNLALAEAGVISDNSIYKRAGLEIEASQAVKDRTGINTPGVSIPLDVLSTRSLSAGTATAGGHTVATDLLAKSFIDVLRTRSVVMFLGATPVRDLVGNVKIPRKTSGSTAGWISTEGGDAGQSDPQFDQVSLTPKTLGAHIDVTRQLVLQSSVDMLNLMMSDLAAGIATAIDVAALYGTGADGQPTGLVNNSDINTPTDFVGSTPTWAEVVAMETAVATNNAEGQNMAYILDADMKGRLSTTEKFSGTGKLIYELGNIINTHRAIMTGNCAAGDMWFGNWSDLLIGMWGGLDLLVDRYTYSLSGTVRIVAHQTVDIAARHPEAFCYNTASE